MRKKIINPGGERSTSESASWLKIDEMAEVEITSEDPGHPIEAALRLRDSAGWRAGSSGPQTISLTFDQPLDLRHIQLLFIETLHERQQEFSLSWSRGFGQPMREIVRQQFNFSPSGAMREIEDYHVSLSGVRQLEVVINPDRSAGVAHASLAHLRVV